MSEWTSWNGGNMPILRDIPTWIKTRTNDIHLTYGGRYPFADKWEHEGHPDDIVAYCVINEPSDIVGA